MKNILKLVMASVVCIMGSVSAAYMPMTNNYNNFMRQYQGREYQIITSNNMINMDWARGAVNALRYDGYTQNKDIALFLWQNIANIVNFTATLPANRNNVEEFKRRIWGSLERTVNEVNPQQQYYAMPVQNAPTRPLPTAPARPLPVPGGGQMMAVSLSLGDIMNGSLGSDYAMKVREVNNYNYDKARKGGFINLASAMSKDINEINNDTSLNQSAKIVDIKKAIDRCYTVLGKYRIRDKQ